MKHFLVEIIYKAPIEKIEELTQSHREFLQTGYQKGILLLSGPKVPRTGGIVIAKANSLKEIMQFFLSDPYSLNNAANYNYIEFNPKSYQQILSKWFSTE